MARRLVAFALAFAVVGGPLAEEICEAVCADSSGHSLTPTTAAHHHHSFGSQTQASHHHPSPDSGTPTTKVAMSPAPPTCGHLDAVVTESREVARPIGKAMVATVSITPILVRTLPASDVDSRHGPPSPIRSTSPLRI
jgi:hypothetical protein